MRELFERKFRLAPNRERFDYKTRCKLVEGLVIRLQDELLRVRHARRSYEKALWHAKKRIEELENCSPKSEYGQNLPANSRTQWLAR